MSLGILKLLVLQELHHGTRTGYGLMKSLEEKFGKRPSTGTMYPLLQSLVEKKMIAFTQEGTKKYYTLTSKGKKTMERLLSEKEDALKKTVSVLKSIDSFTDEESIKKFITSLDTLTKERVLLNHYSAGLLRIKYALLQLLQLTPTKEIQDKVNVILHETAYSLEQVVGDIK